MVITCPVRFRERWVIADDAAEFFGFPDGEWTSVTEVHLHDRNGNLAGNIDVVVVRHDEVGRITDFGAIEIQAVYVSGNISTPFRAYMRNPPQNANMDWRGASNYPRPDYLSSSRKRLAPQLMCKGAILPRWGKKMAVVLNWGLYQSLPTLTEVDPSEAEVAWMVYDLSYSAEILRYTLHRRKITYTKLEPSIAQITRVEPGDPLEFIRVLEEKLRDKLAREDISTTEPLGDELR